MVDLTNHSLNEGQWIHVGSCPACSCPDSISQGSLPGFAYHFGEENIPFPLEGISVVSCEECNLIYKTVVPSPHFLTEVFARQAGKVWGGAYDFSDEIEMIAQLVGRGAFDLLDVGASNGGLLRARADIPGRRSALDLLPYPGLEAHLRGEFIEGFLDTPDVSWSQQAYDVITLFDLFEHIYQPNVAFRNLKMLVKNGGFVVVETGDTDSDWPRKLGINHWWYASLFEHHIFWSRRSIEHMAKAHGFEIFRWEQKRHKSQQGLSLLRKVRELLKVGLYRLSPKQYYRLVKTLDKRVIQPWSPLAKDHMNVILKPVNQSTANHNNN